MRYIHDTTRYHKILAMWDSLLSRVYALIANFCHSPLVKLAFYDMSYLTICLVWIEINWNSPDAARFSYNTDRMFHPWWWCSWSVFLDCGTTHSARSQLHIHVESEVVRCLHWNAVTHEVHQLGRTKPWFPQTTTIVHDYHEWSFLYVGW